MNLVAQPVGTGGSTLVRAETLPDRIEEITAQCRPTILIQFEWRHRLNHKFQMRRGQLPERVRSKREWKQAMETYLNDARIILLVASSSFIASDYCYSMQIQQAIKRHERKEASVIPIILPPCIWRCRHLINCKRSQMGRNQSPHESPRTRDLRMSLPIKIWLSYVKEAELRFGGYEHLYEHLEERPDRGNTG